MRRSDAARPGPAMMRPRRGRGARAAWAAAALAVAAAAAWLAGLAWFAGQIPRTVAEPLAETDAIVVLTGGAGRLSTGLALLAEGRARKLFVSGVYRSVDVAEILRVSRRAPEELECCIELGHDASDTRGNAAETRRWMDREGFASLRLVTASYHMPRSLAEFRRAMPEARIVPHPVFPPTVHVEAWWRWPGTALLLAGEFAKYLIAVARPGADA